MKRILFAAASTVLLANVIGSLSANAAGIDPAPAAGVSAAPVSAVAGLAVTEGAAAATSELTAASAAVGPTVLPANPEFDWPSGEAVPVLRKFQVGKYDWQPGHRGVDLALAAGDAVYAAGAGKVIYAGRLNDRELVSIEHAGGVRTTYEPVKPTVHRGDIVQLGQKIGVVTGTHCAPFSCLHWGAKLGAKNYINPLSLLPDQQIRLLE